MSTDSTEYSYLIRIANTDVPGHWFVPHALTHIPGVGIRLATLITRKAEIPLDLRIGYLNEQETKALETIILEPSKHGIPNFLLNRKGDRETGDDLHIVSMDLPIYLKDDIDRLKKIQCYRGIRHHLGLRVRGQRTRTSGRGGRTVGVIKKKLRTSR
ncbi:MAG: 30S ribosomal protein S13 [Candidatus Hodarchaeales archaeon]|jgi:small subunit ribosomal protein S13